MLFSLHDPTQLNRQGNDIGTQYRSIIFHHSKTQRLQALQMISLLNAEKRFDFPIVTLVEPNTTFYPAEAYHQDFVTANPNNPYCIGVVSGKLKKFRQQFSHLLK